MPSNMRPYTFYDNIFVILYQYLAVWGRCRDTVRKRQVSQYPMKYAHYFVVLLCSYDQFIVDSLYMFT